MLKSILIIASVLLISACATDNVSEEEKMTLNPLKFEFDSAFNYGQPYLYKRQDGEVLMSFIKTDQNGHQLMYSTLQDSTWSKPNQIAQGKNWFVNWADYPQISSFKNQGLLSFFLEKSGDGVYSYDIQLIRSAQGQDWTDPELLHDDGKQAEHGFVSFIPFEDYILTAWLDGRNTAGENDEHHGHHGGAMTLRAALLDTKGQKADEWELDDKVCDCCQTSAAMTSNGPVVVYRDRSEEEIRNISIVRYLDGEWTSPRPVYPDNWKIPGCPVNGPRVDGMDNLVGVAWFAAPNGRTEVKVAFSQDAGETFLAPIVINTSNTIGRVDFVLVDDSHGIVSWMEGADILARKVSVDGNTGPIVHISSSSDQRSSGFPQMVLSTDELIFAWTDSQNGSSKILTASSPIGKF